MAAPGALAEAGCRQCADAGRAEESGEALGRARSLRGLPLDRHRLQGVRALARALPRWLEHRRRGIRRRHGSSCRAPEAPSAHRRQRRLRHPSRGPRRHRVVRLAGRAGSAVVPRPASSSLWARWSWTPSRPHRWPGPPRASSWPTPWKRRLLALRALQKGPPVTAVGPGLEGTGRAWRLAFSPSGDWLASSGPDEVWLRYQEGGASAPVGDFERRTVSPISIAFGAEGLLVTDQNGEIRWWSVQNRREIRQAESNRGRLHLPLRDGYFSFAETQGRDSLRWWPFDGGTSRLLGKIGTAFTNSREEKPIYQAYTNVVVDATNSRMAYPRGKAVYLRSLEDLDQPPRRLGEHPAKVVGLALHPRGDRIAAIDEAAGIRIWAMTGPPANLLQTIRTDAVYFISFEPTGRWLAGHEVVDGRPTVRLWDMTAPQGVEPLTLQRSDVIWSHQVVVHPTRPWLVTAHGDNTGFWPLSGRYP